LPGYLASFILAQRYFTLIFLHFLVIGCGTFVSGYLNILLWSVASERQIRRLRETLFRTIINREIAYFDISKTGELNARLVEGVNTVHDGIGKKVAFLFQYLSIVIMSIIYSYASNLNNRILSKPLVPSFIFRLIKGWKLTLFLLFFSPLIFISEFVFSQVSRSVVMIS
jgi:ABC-type multidrug transport system fused ATPase/permease subunit